MPDDPPPTPWDTFLQALILERFGRTCPELPRLVRERKREEDRAQQRWIEELEAAGQPPVFRLPEAS